MANVLVEETSLSNIASAIREKSGGSATYKPGEMAAAISNLPTGGNSEDEILTRSGSGEYVNDRIETLGGGAFYQTNYSTITLSNVKVMDGASIIRFNNNLTSLNLPALTTITCTYIEPSKSTKYGSQISNNASLTTLNFPNLTTMSDSVAGSFQANPNLVSVSMPSLTTANLMQGFAYCPSLETVDLSSLQSSPNAYWSFTNCSSLQSINLPNLTQWDEMYETFSGCTNLQSVNLPNLTGEILGSGAFENCTSLQTIELNISTFPGRHWNPFYGCTSLTKVKAPLAHIEGFSKCNKLRTLILPQTDKVAVLENGTAFNDTLIGKNQNSGIYVPRVLLNDYKTATNWVTLSNYIYAIEDYPDITGG